MTHAKSLVKEDHVASDHWEKYGKKHRELYKEKYQEIDRLYKQKTYSSRRDTILKNRYGIVEFDYEELAKAQDNKCAICGTPPVKKRLDLDHCHETKKIRGLLCNNCNRGLGHFKDNPALLSKAIEYLDKSSTIV